MQVLKLNCLCLLLLRLVRINEGLPSEYENKPLVYQSSRATCENEESYENQQMCVGQPFGELMPYPGNCNLYLVCDCEYPTVMPCAPNLWFNNVVKSCDFPQNVTDCSTSGETQTSTTKSTTQTDTTTEKTPPTAAATTTEKTPPTAAPTASSEATSTTASTDCRPAAPPGIDDNYCADYEDGSVHRYPYDCNAYINCTNGWPVLNYCEPDKVFNQLLLICDTPDTADCEELPLTTASSTTSIATTPTTGTTATTPGSDEGCDDPPLGVEEDYCGPLGNGFYDYAYNCSAYIICHNGCSSLDYCIPDKLFNSLLHICDTPDAVDCDPEPLTSSTAASSSTASSSTASTTTTTAGLPADVDPDACLGFSDNTCLPYAGNCSQYLHCLDNEVVVGNCPSDLLFNPDLLICDEADGVVCYGDRTTTVSTTSAATSPGPSTTASPSELCTGKEQGATFPYEADCQKYIICLGNDMGVLASCISNTWYNPQTGDCDSNVSPTACQQQETTTTKPATTASPSQLCDSKELGATFPYEADCSKYVLCLGNKDPMIVDCIYNGWYDPSTGECGPNVSQTACQESGEASSSTTTSTTVATTTQKPSTGICNGKHEGEMIAYPSNCSKYIVCVTPIPVAFYCLDGLYFNEQLQQCVCWENSGCSSSTTSSPSQTTTPTPQLPTICTNSSRDTFPYPENCQWFLRCINDYDYMVDSCNCGEYYDPVTERCGTDVSPDACRGDYSTTSTTAVTPSTRPPAQTSLCDGVEEGKLVAYPNDCTKYIKCELPIPTVYSCDKGDGFSDQLQQCVEASLVGCDSGTTESTSSSTTSSSTASPSTTSSSTAAPSTTSSSTTSSSTASPSTTSPSTTSSSTTSSSTTSSSTTSPSTTSSSTQSSTSSSTTTESSGSGGICTDKLDGTLVPYPYNCSKYIVCASPIPIGYDCPENLEFSPTELVCMEPDVANCTPLTPSTSTPTTTGTLPPDVSNICCDQPQGTRLPYPGDCSKYVVCDYPLPYVVQCESGHVYSEALKDCVASYIFLYN